MSNDSSLFDLNHARSIAATAILIAHSGGHDVGEFVAQVCGEAAAALGDVDALLANRPGSWEASHVRALVEGTVT